MKVNYVSPRALQEFKDLYLQEYGEKLDDKTARKKAIGLLKVMRIVYGPLKVPISESEVKEYGKTQNQKDHSPAGRQG